MKHNYTFKKLKSTSWKLMLSTLLLGGVTFNAQAGVTVSSQSFNQAAKITSSDAFSGDKFGRTVAIDGNFAIVGARDENHDASGGTNMNKSGSAYIFELQSGNWVQTQKIVASDRAANDEFGTSVAISGIYAIVGAPKKDSDEGAVYIFENMSGTWTQIKKLTASDAAAGDLFGSSVSIDGTNAIVGAPERNSSEGAAYGFALSGTWNQVGSAIVASDAAVGDKFGFSVAVSGMNAVVGAPEKSSKKGAAYVFNSTTWAQVGSSLLASDAANNALFGNAVDIDGTNLIVGAPKASGGGSAYAFAFTTSWAEKDKLQASDRANNDDFGQAVAINGNNAIVGAHKEDQTTSFSGDGAAYAFKLSTNWTETEKIVVTNTGVSFNYQFGFSIGFDGTRAIVGIDQTIKNDAYIFDVCDGGVLSVEDTAVCDGYMWRGMMRTMTATYNDVAAGAAMNGCDSTFVLNLTINNNAVTIAPVGVCNSSYTIEGNVYTTSGVKTFTSSTPNQFGCDSVVTFTLTLGSGNVTGPLVTLQKCNGASTTSFSGNQTWTTPGMYLDTVLTTGGCDSTFTVDYQWMPALDLTVIQSGSVLTASTTSTGIASWIWRPCGGGSTKSTNNTFTIPDGASYEVRLRIGTCEEVSSCFSLPTGLDEVAKGVSLNVYPNPNNGQFTIDLNSVNNESFTVEITNTLGQTVKTLELENGTHTLSLPNVNSGIYTIKFQDSTTAIQRQIVVQ